MGYYQYCFYCDYHFGVGSAAVMSNTVKLLIALQADDTVLLQISQDDTALGYICLQKEDALKVADKIKLLADRIPNKKSN